MKMSMEEWMLLIRENQSTRSKICSSTALSWNRNRAFAVTGKWLTAWATRVPNLQSYIHIDRFGSYRAINTFSLGHKNRSVNTVGISYGGVSYEKICTSRRCNRQLSIIVNIINESICSRTAWNWVVANNFIWTAQYKKKYFPAHPTILCTV
jgi:hypothetical protein